MLPVRPRSSQVIWQYMPSQQTTHKLRAGMTRYCTVALQMLAAGFRITEEAAAYGCALCEAVLDVAQQVRRQPGEEAQVRILVALGHGTEDSCYVVYCCYWLRHAVLGSDDFDDGAAAPLQWSAMRFSNNQQSAKHPKVMPLHSLPCSLSGLITFEDPTGARRASDKCSQPA
jgi:hypothetical protein